MFGDDNEDYSGYFDPTDAQARAAAVRGGRPPAANLSPQAQAQLAVLRGQPLPQPNAAAPTTPPSSDNSDTAGLFGTMGFLASAAGNDPVLAPFARSAMQYGNQMQEREGQKLQRLIEQNRNNQLAHFHQDEVADRRSQIGLQREEMNHGRFRPFIDPTSGRSGILDSWTGQLVNGAAAPTGAAGEPTAPPISSRGGQNIEKTAERYAEEMNPAKAAPDLWKKLQFGARIKPMIQQALDSKGEMSDQMARELASAFASYVSSGGAPAEGQVHALLPPSFTGNLANFSNYLTGNMSGADRSAWLNQIKQSLEREEPVIQGGIQDVLRHKDLGFPAMRSGSLGETRKQIIAGLRRQGYSLEEAAAAADGAQTPTSAAGLNLDAPAQPHPQDSVAVTWAKAHLNDPKFGAKASAILKANGVQ